MADACSTPGLKKIGVPSCPQGTGGRDSPLHAGGNSVMDVSSFDHGLVWFCSENQISFSELGGNLAEACVSMG